MHLITPLTMPLSHTPSTPANRTLPLLTPSDYLSSNTQRLQTLLETDATQRTVNWSQTLISTLGNVRTECFNQLCEANAQLGQYGYPPNTPAVLLPVADSVDAFDIAATEAKSHGILADNPDRVAQLNEFGAQLIHLVLDSVKKAQTMVTAAPAQA